MVDDFIPSTKTRDLADFAQALPRCDHLVEPRGHGHPPGSSRHSGLMFAVRITLPQRSVCSAMSLPNSAGEPDKAVPPRPASRTLIAASERPAFVSALSFSTIWTGVCRGTPR